MKELLLQAAKNALADLQGIMPEHEPSGDRKHPAWKTIKELKAAIKAAEKPSTITEKIVVRVAWNRAASNMVEEKGWDKMIATSKDKNYTGDDMSFDEEEFNTKEEAEAYMKGIGDSNGWDDPMYELKQPKVKEPSVGLGIASEYKKTFKS